MAPALSAQTPWVQLSVSCRCMLAHRTRVEALLAGDWLEQVAGTSVSLLLLLGGYEISQMRAQYFSMGT